MEGRPANGALVTTATVTVTVLDESSDPQPDEALARWAELVRAVLETEGVTGPAEADVVFVDAEEMAALNAEHMGGTGPTDVLSFPIDDEVDEVDEVDEHGDVRLVGDIVVCRSVAVANAPDHAGDPDDEVALLLVHGSLHLLGHDHAHADERDRMWAAERRLLDAHWRPLAADPWAAIDDRGSEPGADS